MSSEPTLGAEHGDTGGTLVIQPLPGIGDAIWHLPHVKAIAEATVEGKVTLLTKPRSRADELLAGCTFVRDVLWLDRDGGRHGGLLGGWRLGAELRPHGFDRVWILHGSARYGLAAVRAGIRERIGYGAGWQGRFLTAPGRLSDDARKARAIDKATLLLAANGIGGLDPVPHLPLPAERLDEVRETHVDLPRPWATFAIGASERFKQWGAERFTALAQRMLDGIVGTVFLLGGPDERDMAARIAAGVPGEAPVVPVIGRPLLHGAAVAAESALCVGNDTGLLNVAAAVGTDCIGLFGGSPVLTRDPRIHALTPPSGSVPFGTDRMAEITVDAVSEVAIRAVGGPRDQV